MFCDRVRSVVRIMESSYRTQSYFNRERAQWDVENMRSVKSLHSDLASKLNSYLWMSNLFVAKQIHPQS